MKDKDKLFDELHSVLIHELLERIRQGTATSADLSVARQFLKDNNIESTDSTGENETMLRSILDNASKDWDNEY